MKSLDQNICKICGSNSLNIFRHTAKCRECGVLLYYPYPLEDKQLVDKGEKKFFGNKINWYSRSSFNNHNNFTNMLRFTIDQSFTKKSLDVLDFGGGGGQFASVCKSHFPLAKVYITDIDDSLLFDEWAPFNIQIPHLEFEKDNTRFDFIFLNDVFEHLSNPSEILGQLLKKLKPNGKIFIDTPRQFCIYPITKILSKNLYGKLIKGNVSKSHLQIWSRKSFKKCIFENKFSILKYLEIGEFTMDPDFYLNNMQINLPFLRFCGKFFYFLSKKFFKNKITVVLIKN